MGTEREPAEVYCLAEFLAEEMLVRGWTAADVGRRMCIALDWKHDALVLDVILAVQKDGLQINDETFDGLARAFDISPQFFRNIDEMWRKWPDRRVPFECPDNVFSKVATFRDTP